MKKWIIGAVFVVSVVSFADVTLAGVTIIGQPFTFPYTITTPGSYQLGTNIKVPTANTTAILVKADNVTIDLNGFAILGPTVCTGTPVTSCAPTGTGNGIDAGSHTNVKVYNGTVRGMGNNGIAIEDAAIVQSVRVESNGYLGIDVDGNGMVSGSTADYNGFIGISAGTATVSGSTAIGNGSYGIYLFSGGTVSGNRASANGTDGIFVGEGTVSGNTANGNGGYGLNFGPFVGYTNNVVNFNAGGTITGGVSLGFGNTNLCNGATC